MNRKAKGARNERRSRKMLENLGYKCMKAGGSLGVWDLIGINRDRAVLVQVKTGAWPGTEEMIRIMDFECPDQFIKILHKWMPRKRMPEVKVITKIQDGSKSSKDGSKLAERVLSGRVIAGV